MRFSTRSSVVASAVIAATFIIGGCGGVDAPSGEDSTLAPTQVSSAEAANLERTVINAINIDDRPVEVRYEASEDHLVLTVYTLGDDLTPEEIEEFEAAAEAASSGVDVVVHLTSDDAPVADN